ncbi:hypothetical protein DMENIID0001_100220 [Sergentomyia squamirostris]
MLGRRNVRMKMTFHPTLLRLHEIIYELTPERDAGSAGNYSDVQFAYTKAQAASTSKECLRVVTHFGVCLFRERGVVKLVFPPFCGGRRWSEGGQKVVKEYVEAWTRFFRYSSGYITKPPTK